VQEGHLFIWNGECLHRVILFAHHVKAVGIPNFVPGVNDHDFESSRGAPIMSLRWSQSCARQSASNVSDLSATGQSETVLVSGGKDGKVRLWRLEDVSHSSVDLEVSASEQMSTAASSSASEDSHVKLSFSGDIKLKCTGTIDAVVESKLAVNAGDPSARA
jgi:hypothetical protein